MNPKLTIEYLDRAGKVLRVEAIFGEFPAPMAGQVVTIGRRLYRIAAVGEDHIRWRVTVDPEG